MPNTKAETAAKNPPVPKPYVQLLVQLDGATYGGVPYFDGSAEFDRYGRPIVGAEKRMISGDSAAWLWLLSRGCIEHLPNSERIHCTKFGKELVNEWHARLSPKEPA